MNRRQFLRIAFTTLSSLAVNRLIVPNFSAKAYYQGYNLFDLLGAYAGRVGASTVRTLNTSECAREQRSGVNAMMMNSGFTLRPDGRPVTDIMDVSDIPQNSKYRRVGKEFYGFGSQFVSPFNPRTYIPDICVPFFVDYCDSSTGVPLFEGPAVIGTSIATAQYMYENPRTTSQQLSDVFFPTDSIENSPASIYGTLVAPEPFVETYETSNGTVSVGYTPPRTIDDEASVEVTARGRVNFSNEYPFQIT